ncbi:MAG TPA: hypothetical protein ENI17_07940 [Pseudomonas xinjiangensis]|uniref:Uncharacterized protein n=2 Tax=root TaxID=1 RepID=A0A7V1BL92_9GAMM|nr:hypothetical protein [Halopseudomonas xinjiangensis]HEC47544.1 hypothetical protein [Halopseudomonas xinjiangensis]
MNESKEEVHGKGEKKQRKTGAIIIRVNDEERQVIDDKVAAAGYKSTSAYVRDYIAREKPKLKTEISPKTLEMQRELMALSSLLNSKADRSIMMSKVAALYKLAMGV